MDEQSIYGLLKDIFVKTIERNPKKSEPLNLVLKEIESRRHCPKCGSLLHKIFDGHRMPPFFDFSCLCGYQCYSLLDKNHKIKNLCADLCYECLRARKVWPGNELRLVEKNVAYILKAINKFYTGSKVESIISRIRYHLDNNDVQFSTDHLSFLSHSSSYLLEIARGNDNPCMAVIEEYERSSNLKYCGG